jgi:hypothetical protein
LTWPSRKRVGADANPIEPRYCGRVERAGGIAIRETRKIAAILVAGVVGPDEHRRFASHKALRSARIAGIKTAPGG